MIVKIHVKTNRVRENESDAAFNKRVNTARDAVKAALKGVSKPITPITVTLRRVAPSGKMAVCLLPCLETIQYFVNSWIGQDAYITWKYAQRPGKKDEWLVDVEWA